MMFRAFVVNLGLQLWLCFVAYQKYEWRGVVMCLPNVLTAGLMYWLYCFRNKKREKKAP